MSYRVGVDIGGTFTDFIAFDEVKGVQAAAIKIPSSKISPIQTISSGLMEIKKQIEPGQIINLILHGTTIGVNTVLESKGVSPYLLTTDGFRDVYEIGRQWRGVQVYDLFVDKSMMVTPRECIFEIPERVGYDGNVITPLDLVKSKDVISKLKELGAKTIAISLIFSFANPTHELQLKKMIKEQIPEAFVYLSSEVDPQFREYERTATTIAHAYVGPDVTVYLRKLKEELKKRFPESRILIMQSNGGVGTPDAVASKPCHTFMSGPVAGVMGTKYLGSVIGHKNVITIDIGGTSTDMSVIPGEILTRSDLWIHRHIVRVPAVDINTIGAGGGSIAKILYGGHTLKVGPQSAGADPGPACYGKGGTDATLTDALVELGHLSRDYLLDGTMPMNYELAKKAIKDNIADPLGMNTIEAAAGIVRVLLSEIAGSMRSITIEKGYDPREFVLMAFGGLGPTIGSVVCKELDISTMIVPINAGAFCAWGMLTTDICKEKLHTDIGLINEYSNSKIVDHLHKLEKEIIAELESERWKVEEEKGGDKIKIEYFIEMRYSGQSYEVPVPIEIEDNDINKDKLMHDFNNIHGRLYGHKAEGEPIEAVNFKVKVTWPLPKLMIQKKERLRKKLSSLEPIEERKVSFEGRFIETPIYKRKSLDIGIMFEGPAIINELTSTTVVYPQQTCTVDPYGNILVSW